MNSRWFDDLSKAIAASASRRSLLRSGMASAVLALMGLAQDGSLAANAKTKGRPHTGSAAKKKGGGKGSGGNGGGGKKNGTKGGCTKNADCHQSNNPCNKTVCQGGTCHKENRQDGASCGVGSTCQNGQCVGVIPSPGPTCPAGQTQCPGVGCVTTSDNVAHCGACGLACGLDQPCQNSHCADCDPSGTTCTAGSACCTGVCSCGNVSNPEANRCHGTAFSQTFASTVAGWYDFDPNTGIVPGTPTTIELQGGVAIIHAGSTHDGDKTAFTLWGGYSATFPPGGYDTEIEIYLDPVSAPADTDFGYTSVINNTDCNAIDDSSLSLVHVGTNADRSKFCVGTSSHDQPPCGNAALPVEITTADWYTFRHTFRKDGSSVVIRIELRRGTDLLKTWPPIVVATPGGNRYGWFPVNQFAALKVRNSKRTPA